VLGFRDGDGTQSIEDQPRTDSPDPAGPAAGESLLRQEFLSRDCATIAVAPHLPQCPARPRTVYLSRVCSRGAPSLPDRGPAPFQHASAWLANASFNSTRAAALNLYQSHSEEAGLSRSRGQSPVCTRQRFSKDLQSAVLSRSRGQPPRAPNRPRRLSHFGRRAFHEVVGQSPCAQESAPTTPLVSVAPFTKWRPIAACTSPA